MFVYRSNVEVDSGLSKFKALAVLHPNTTGWALAVVDHASDIAPGRLNLVGIRQPVMHKVKGHWVYCPQGLQHLDKVSFTLPSGEIVSYDQPGFYFLTPEGVWTRLSTSPGQDEIYRAAVCQPTQENRLRAEHLTLVLSDGRSFRWRMIGQYVVSKLMLAATTLRVPALGMQEYA